MNDDDAFILEIDTSNPPRGDLAGWEDVVFELADEEDLSD